MLKSSCDLLEILQTLSRTHTESCNSLVRLLLSAGLKRHLLVKKGAFGAHLWLPLASFIYRIALTFEQDLILCVVEGGHTFRPSLTEFLLIIMLEISE